ncbi:tetratricopeptide repeat protein [Sphingobium sp. SJ10-10]|uniref:tetratricopeptide repeat protein n=1 Tax=Sphingobium sp. SJ10-10 TaxID=3114999 RepID=UPI002E178829|nr:tetratricopeptide repeat protein [Sphingobium sp. SJ10-10]
MNKAVIVIALIIATTACSSGQKGVLSIRPVNQQSSGPAQDALARGDLLFSRGEYALALDAFRRAVRNDPTDAHGLNGVAISYAAMGRHDLAREFFELALARAPQDARIARNFARSLSAQGLKGEADALLAQAGAGTAGMVMAMRPTLAQLASAAPAARPAQLAGVELERVSLGEVRLRTMETALPAERVKPQLTTRIVTVAETKAQRELTAPIITVVKAETQALPKLAGTAGEAAGPVMNEKTANAEGRDDLFERLWKSLMRPAGRKGARG